MVLASIVSPYWHYFFDFLAYAVSGYLLSQELQKLSESARIYDDPVYWRVLAGSAILGALLLGSYDQLAQIGHLNLLSSVKSLRIGHSVAGAIFGGIIGIELYKLMIGKKESTGFVFVLPLLAGIAIGRWGCLLSGLKDNTYGIETSGFGVDVGDGIQRHPVAIYESLACLITFFIFRYWKNKNLRAFQKQSFYLFTISYCTQRFFWEFLKPYPKILSSSLNVFHFVCIALTIYALLMLKRNADVETSQL